MKQTIKNLLVKFLSHIYKRDLTKLAKLYGTDKYGSHFYTQHYEHHFRKYRSLRFNLLEIGIGGYDDPMQGGNSLRMWKSFFPKANVYGIDIYDKSFHDDERIKTFKGSQTDNVFLREVCEEIGHIDIIIDDGSHINDHVISSFKFLFPLLEDNGIYVVEDTQTSYWNNHMNINWGGSEDRNALHTSMGFFKSLIDGLNYQEFLMSDYTPTYFDRNIISMHFYHNLIFIYKGQNNEGSSLIN